MTQFNGLTSQEVKDREKRGQTNNFKARGGRTYLDIIRDNVFNLFNIVLFSLLLVAFLFGDYGTVFFSGFSVFTNTLLGLFQEIQAKRKLDRMAALSAGKVKVWRDGVLETIPMTRIVLDDVIVVEPGDRIAVDGTILRSDSLEVDESQLTGESDAVFKNPEDPIYSGSFCIAGAGLMVATKVGAESTVNKLSTIAREYKRHHTPTQRKLFALVEISVLVMVIFAPLLLLAGWRMGETALGMVRNEVVFVTSLVPQGLVLVATVSLTIGAVKISRHKTLIQRLNAIESMANVTTLCFDKTGTLTQNKLAVTEILPLNGQSPDAIAQDLSRYITSLSYQNRTAGAIAEYLQEENVETVHDEKEHEIPFSSGRKWGAVTFADATLVLGAPERIISDADVMRHTQELSAQGMRVLAFAEALDRLDGNIHINQFCKPFALIVMSDQIRNDIRTTLEDFRELGVKLKVISGDNVETVRSIAGASGLPIELAYTGDELEAMSQHEFENAVIDSQVFARIEPDTKRKIVEVLKRNGEYVAMVGDGVNDVPALKAADLAIVMNDGTQISKDVADIVLLNNAMSTLPRAFREGREITQTIFGTTKMFLAKNGYNFIMFVLIAFAALPFAITPAQVSISAFGTVNMPATLIAFGLMRPKYISHFRRDVLDYILTVGLIGGVCVTALFGVTYVGSGGDLELARSLVTIFVSLLGMMIVWNVQGVEIHNIRSFRDHPLVVAISSVVTLLTIVAFYLLPNVFEFQAPDPNTLQGLYLIGLLTALFLLCMLLIDVNMRKRGVLHQLWVLVQND